LPSELEVSALPALHGGNGPVGGMRGVGVGVAEGLAVAAGEGLVVSDGLGVGAAIAGLEKSANAKEATAVTAAEILK
jgi:hypothetical protein